MYENVSVIVDKHFYLPIAIFEGYFAVYFPAFHLPTFFIYLR